MDVGGLTTGLVDEGRVLALAVKRVVISAGDEVELLLVALDVIISSDGNVGLGAGTVSPLLLVGY